MHSLNIQTFLHLYCGSYSITNTVIRGNSFNATTTNSGNDECLFCIGYDSNVQMMNVQFIDNSGPMIYTAYYGPGWHQSYDDSRMLSLNMVGVNFTNHSNTGIVFQSNTVFPQTISSAALSVEESTFTDDQGFILLYPNSNANIQIQGAMFNNNTGEVISSDTSSSIPHQDTMQCVDEIGFGVVSGTGLYLIQTTISS